MGFQLRYPKNNFVTDDAYLTPLHQHVQLIFVHHMDKIECVGLILKVSYQLQVCVAYLIHHPGLSSASLVKQEIYDESCTSMQNVCIRPKLVRAP